MRMFAPPCCLTTLTALVLSALFNLLLMYWLLFFP
jgi:hypothetical protein